LFLSGRWQEGGGKTTSADSKFKIQDSRRKIKHARLKPDAANHPLPVTPGRDTPKREGMISFQMVARAARTRGNLESQISDSGFRIPQA